MDENREIMELSLRTDLAVLPQTIDFNFDELHEQIAKKVEFYGGLVVTEDTIKAAKEDRARLNKLRESLDASRKDIKKVCLAPYGEFETKIKKLLALIDEPIANIDRQLDEFEKRRREAKRADIEAIYTAVVPDELKPLVPLEKLWQDDWYNVSMSLKKIETRLAASMAKIRSDLAALSTVESEFAEVAGLKYFENFDLNEALTERMRLQERAKLLREQEAAQSAATSQVSEREALVETYIPAEQANPATSSTWGVEEPKQTAAHDHAEPADQEPQYRLSFECIVTKREAAELGEWLRARNISFRRI